MSVGRGLHAHKETVAAQGKQRRVVTERDGNKCQFLRIQKTKDGPQWLPCLREAQETAHLIRRPHLSFEAKFHPDMAVRACIKCHDAFDNRPQKTYDVRVPADVRQQAWDTAVALCKVPPPARYNPALDEDA